MAIDDIDAVKDSIRAACAISSTAWLEFTGTIQAKGGAIKGTVRNVTVVNCKNRSSPGPSKKKS